MNKNDKVKTEFNYNYISVILLYVWALAFIVEARNITEPQSRIFPYFIGGIAIFLATILLIKSKFNLGFQDTFDFSGTGKAIKYGVILIIYVALTATLGFYISTPLYLLGGMWMLGQRNKKLMIGVAIGTPLIIFLFFDLILGIKIPMGMFF